MKRRVERVGFRASYLRDLLGEAEVSERGVTFSADTKIFYGERVRKSRCRKKVVGKKGGGEERAEGSREGSKNDECEMMTDEWGRRSEIGNWRWGSARGVGLFLHSARKWVFARIPLFTRAHAQKLVGSLRVRGNAEGSRQRAVEREVIVVVLSPGVGFLLFGGRFFLSIPTPSGVRGFVWVVEQC